MDSLKLRGIKERSRTERHQCVGVEMLLTTRETERSNECYYIRVGYCKTLSRFAAYRLFVF